MNKAINKKALVGIFAFAFVGMANNMTMGILGSIIAAYPQVSSTTVSLVLTLPPLVGAAYAFFVGALSGRFGAKRVAIFGQLALFLEGMIFLFFGGKAPVGVLIAASGLVGFMQGAMNTLLAILLLGVIEDEKKRSSILGIAMAVSSLGGVFFSTVGGVLAVSRWQNAYYLWFIIALCAVLVAILVPQSKEAPAPAEETVKKKSSGKLPAMVWIICGHYLIFFLALYVFGLNVSEYIISTHSLGTSAEAGLGSSMVTIGGIVSGLVFGMYSQRLKKLTIPVLMGLTVIGLLLPVVSPNLISIYAAGLLLGFAMMGANPYIISKLGEMVAPEQYSNAVSIFSGFMNAGMCVAVPVIAFLTKLLCGDDTHVPTKFIVGLIGAAFCFITSFPIYLAKGKKQTTPVQ